MRIGFDLDGVLADFTASYLEVANKMYPDRGYTEEQVLKWEYYDCLPGLTKAENNKIFDEIKATPGFFENLNPYPEIHSVAKLSTMINIYFVTHRFGIVGEDDAIAQTRRWLERFGIRPAGVILHKDKHKVCDILNLEAFLDDKPQFFDNINNASEDTMCYLMDMPYNRDHPAEDLRVHTINEYIYKATGGRFGKR